MNNKATPALGLRLLKVKGLAPLDPMIDKLGIRDKIEPSINDLVKRVKA